MVKHAATGSVDLEVMALSKGSVREVNLKDGSTAKKAEVVLGDDTGEITAVAWDEASKMIGEIQAGEKLLVHGATDPGLEDGRGDARAEPFVEGRAVAGKRVAGAASGLWTPKDLILVHKDDYQAEYEERDHQSAQEIVIAADAQHRNLHGPKMAGNIRLEKHSGWERGAGSP